MNNKIVIIAPAASNIRIFRMEMIKSFIDLGYKITVISTGATDNDLDYFLEHEIKYIESSLQRNGLNPLSDLKYQKQLKQILKRENPLCVFTIAAKPNIYGGIVSHILNIPFYSLVSGLGSIFRGEGFKYSLIKPLFLFLYKLSLRHACSVFVHNDDDKKFLYQHKIILKNQSCYNVHGSGVNTKEYAYKKMPSKPSFLFIGRIIADKGIKEYIAACSKILKLYSDINCSIVGDFDSNPSKMSKDDFFDLIKDTNIKYLGHIEDVRPIIEKHAVFVLPSYHEGLPKSTIEAMSIGRIILTTDVPGCRDTVINNENGFIVTKKDSIALYEKMIYIIENYQNITYMGGKSRKYAEELFDVEKVNKVICNVMKL